MIVCLFLAKVTNLNKRIVVWITLPEYHKANITRQNPQGKTMSSHETKALTNELKLQGAILGGFVALIWVLEIIDQVIPGRTLDGFGIHPRQISGLWGILFAPFLHVSIAHVAANTIPFVALGWLVMLRDIRDFFFVTFAAMTIGGLGTWVFGATGNHIGASGVIFGYLGYLMLRGFFERSIPAIAFSLLVFFLYGGLLWGVLPLQRGISWEGHLFGYVGGVVAAYILSKHHRERQVT